MRPTQRRLNFENHPCALCCDHRRIARELDGVAESLLGVEQHGASRERFAAPLRHGKIPRPQAYFLVLEAPFVAVPAGGVLAAQQSQQGLVPARRGVTGIDGEHLVESGERLVVPAQLDQRQGAVMKRTGIVGTQRDGAVAACDRLLEPLKRLQGGPAIAVRTRVRGVDCDRLVEACERFLGTFELEQHDAAIAAGIGKIRGDRKRPLAARERLVIAFKLFEIVSAIIERGRMIGVELRAHGQRRRPPRRDGRAQTVRARSSKASQHFAAQIRGRR